MFIVSDFIVNENMLKNIAICFFLKSTFVLTSLNLARISIPKPSACPRDLFPENQSILNGLHVLKNKSYKLRTEFNTFSETVLKYHFPFVFTFFFYYKFL